MNIEENKLIKRDISKIYLPIVGFVKTQANKEN